MSGLPRKATDEVRSGDQLKAQPLKTSVRLHRGEIRKKEAEKGDWFPLKEERPWTTGAACRKKEILYDAGSRAETCIIEKITMTAKKRVLGKEPGERKKREERTEDETEERSRKARS